MRVISFFFDGELFAVDVNRVQKIVRKMTLTYVPTAPEAIKGIINLKGKVITVFSLYNLLERKKQGVCYDNKKEVDTIILNSFSGLEDQIGLIIDKPHNLMDIDDEIICATGKDDSCFLTGIAELDNTLYRIINIDSIINKYNADTNVLNGGLYAD